VNDGDGRAPEFSYEDRILAYIDILGWTDVVRRSSTEQSGIEDISTALKALRMAEERARIIRDHETGQSRQHLALEVTLFSDTAVLSCRPNMLAITILVSQVQWFCVDLMLAGLFTRGAIVRGLLHHKDGVIVGPALVEAHQLESTVAKYPRILLADEVTALIPDLSNGDEVTPRVERDRDMLPILDPFASFEDRSVRRERMKAVDERARANQLANRGDVGIRAKMGWLITFLTQQLERIDAPAVKPAGLKRPGT
jgi:hypothetical protein